jgi:hypothetical protein
MTNDTVEFSVADIDRFIVEDVVQHAPGWGQQNIIDDLLRRLGIPPAVTISRLDYLVAAKKLRRDDKFFVSHPDN